MTGREPYLYFFYPPDWTNFWHLEDNPAWNSYPGLLLIIVGFLVTFGRTAWFDWGRSFGRKRAGLFQSGPYRWSRNPQILGGCLLVIGIALQRPSPYKLGWVMLY